MSAVTIKIPTLACSSCQATQEVTPRTVHHVNQLEDQAARDAILKSGFQYVVTAYEPPMNWLLIEFHLTGSNGKLSRWLCPLCHSGDVIVAKAVVDVVKALHVTHS